MGFSKMEQAERWQAKLATLADDEFYSGNMEKSFKLEEQAERLQQAIINIKCKQGTKDDWRIFNNAVNARTLRDVEMKMIREMAL